MLSEIKNLFHSFAANHSRFTDIRPVKSTDWHTLKISTEMYEKASLLADILAFPIGLGYQDDANDEKMLSVVLHEVRKFDNNTYLFKVEYESGKTEILSSNKITEIYVGEYAHPYLCEDDNYDTKLEEEMFKGGLKIWKTTGFLNLWLRFGLPSPEAPPLRPPILEFFKLFELYQNGNYRSLRLKLNILAYLLPTEKRESETEMNIVRKFIAEDKAVIEQDIDKLMAYFEYSVVTPLIFKETVDNLHTVPIHEIQEIIMAAKSFFPANNVPSKELELFDKVLKALAVH